ncbi:MAG TPA: hypothetical protein VGL22_10355 [Terracidiphilus sp.]|jgi:hypothetical protein
MKKTLAVCTALFLALGAATLVSAQQEPAAPATQAAAAAGATGSWSGAIQGPNGDMNVTFNLKQDGAKLTGSVETGMGDPMDIQNGKVDGEKVYWETSFNGMTIQHEGTFSGDEMKIHVKFGDGQMPDQEMSLKRGKA